MNLLTVDGLSAIVIIILSNGIEAICYPAIYGKRTAQRAIDKPPYPTGEKIMDAVGIDLNFGYTKDLAGSRTVAPDHE